MDINNKPEEQDPAKAEEHEMNDDELDTVSGGSYTGGFAPMPAPKPAPFT